tara:strand:+ start:280492 stop:281469 length:978 start_codon:yes stop_codon:yes gene_type:complete
VSEITGHKSGLALTQEQILDHSPKNYSDLLLKNNAEGIRIRSEELEELLLAILYSLGATPYEQKILPIHQLTKEFTERGKDSDQVLAIAKKLVEYHALSIKEAAASASKTLDPTKSIMAVVEQHGKIGLEVSKRYFELVQVVLNQSVIGAFVQTNYDDRVHLKELFDSESLKTQYGEFLDQRFIDYLAKNYETISKMNWRKFEALTAEHFHRNGYTVEIGPGRDDDGVDIRLWNNKPAKGNPPLTIVQCKRYQGNIDKVVVKSLYADVLANQAQSGLIVTTSKLSPGAEKTVKVRGYPIKSIDGIKMREWVTAMKTPETGIFLAE